MSRRARVVSKNGWRDPALVVLAAAAMRVAAWLQLSRTPFFASPVVDASTFDIWARAIAHGTTFPGAVDVFFKPPLYPYLLAGIYGVFGESPTAAYALQMIAGVVTCLLVLMIGRRVFGRAVGLGAAVATGLLPMLPFFEAQLLAESWTTLLTLLALERLLPAKGEGAGEATTARLIQAGLVLGIAALGRPNLMLLILVVGVWAAWDASARRPRRLVRAAAVLAAAAVAILPVTVRNLSVSGEPVLISANFGANLVTGHHDGADGVSAIPVGLRWDDLQLTCREAGAASPAASSRHLTKVALGWMKDHPGRTLELFGRKVLVLVSGWETRNNIGAAWLAREHGVGLLSRWWPGTWLLLPFAMVGLVWAGRRPGTGLLLLATGVQAASVLPFFVNARFRLPLLPLLALFAAAGVVEVGRRLRGGDLRSAVGPVVVLIAAAVIVNVDWLGFDDTRWNAEDAFNEALIVQKSPVGVAPDLDAVERLLQRAIALDPTFADAHERLGVLNLMRGQQGLALLQRDIAGGDIAGAKRRAIQTQAALDAAAASHQEALALVTRAYRSAANIGTAALLAGETNTALAQAALARGDSVLAADEAAAAMTRYRDADRYLGRALTLDPSFQEARSNRQVLAASIMKLPPLTEEIRAAQDRVGGRR